MVTQRSWTWQKGHGLGLSMWPGFAKNLPLCDMVELSGSVVRCLWMWFWRWTRWWTWRWTRSWEAQGCVTLWHDVAWWGTVVLCGSDNHWLGERNQPAKHSGQRRCSFHLFISKHSIPNISNQPGQRRCSFQNILDPKHFKRIWSEEMLTYWLCKHFIIELILNLCM